MNLTDVFNTDAFNTAKVLIDKACVGITKKREKICMKFNNVCLQPL